MGLPDLGVLTIDEVCFFVRQMARVSGLPILVDGDTGFAAEVKVPLLADMTEFGRIPQMTAEAFEALGYKMVIWPVTALRMAAKAHEELYTTLASEGWAAPLLDRMQTRAELYDTIGYHEFEELDGTIARSFVP